MAGVGKWVGVRDSAELQDHLASVPCSISTMPLLLRETNSKPSCRAPSARATSSGDGPCI